MNSLTRLLFTALLALLAPLAARCADDPPAPRLRAEVAVDSAGIYLNQVLDSSFHETLPKLRLAPAPPLGQTVSLSRRQIIDLASNSVPALNTTNWSGPELVRISRRVRQMCEADVTELLRAALQRDYVGGRGTLEIHLSRPWQATTVPDEPVTLQLGSVPAAGVLPYTMAGFELWCGKERIGAWQVSFQAHVWRDIPVAHSPILPGQLLHDADITLERRDVLYQHQACVPFPITNKLLEAACSIQAGAPITSRLARPRAVMHRGQMVEAVFQEGSMTISLKVEALEDGTLGQTVRVRNPKTSRELYGKIQNEDLISITL